jgi:flagellar protein FliS
MTPPTNLADKYRSQAIQTAPGPQLLVMLYDRLAVDVDIAGRSLDEQDFLVTNERLQHAQRIVRMLKHSLEPDGFAGGRDLLALYDFLLSHLVEANLRKDPEMVRECGRIIAPLREAWQRAVTNPDRADGQRSVG